MGNAVGVVLGAVLFYCSIISPLNRQSERTAMVRQPEPVRVVTPGPDRAASRPVGSTRQRIIERVPAHYDLFHEAAKYALKSEESCKGVDDIDATTFAWGLIGHWKKEAVPVLCVGAPDEQCEVSSTGARGPMQFQPSTWEDWGRDGDNDGVKNSENIADSAYAAAAYLCELRRKTGSWGHAMCRYYGDNVDTCVYERRVRAGIETIETVLREEEERKRLEAEAAKNKKSSMTLSKANSTSTVR